MINFFRDINLKLKDYGDVNLKLVLYDKNQLNMHVYASNDEFKDLVRQNIPNLRSALIDIQVTPREIRVFEPRKKKVDAPSYGVIDDNLQMGFEIKA